jgi:arylsulfatase A
VDRPAGRPVDGVSLRPLIEGDGKSWPDRALFTHREADGKESAMYPGTIRTQRYNLVNGRELYDMIDDPGEQRDLAASQPEKVRELRGRYEDWFHTAIAERGLKRYALPVGHPEENPVYLPATQAQFTGKIRFNNGNGFAHDWLTGWSDLKDTVGWDIDVAAAGQYRVTLHYLCPSEAIGSEVEVSVAGLSRKVKVVGATSMDPLPDRNLVYVKHYVTMDWGKLDAGVVELPKGLARLSLQALAKPGDRVMDVKAAVVERLR